MGASVALTSTAGLFEAVEGAAGLAGGVHSRVADDSPLVLTTVGGTTTTGTRKLVCVSLLLTRHFLPRVGYPIKGQPGSNRPDFENKGIKYSSPRSLSDLIGSTKICSRF